MDKKSNIIRFPLERARPDLKKGKGKQPFFDQTLYDLLRNGDHKGIWEFLKK